MIDPRLAGLRRVAMVSAAVAISSCGSGDLLLPNNASMAIGPVAGENQTGPVGMALADSLVVRVADPGGVGVAGIAVSWSASGGGSVSPSASITDADGRAATQRILGAEPGAYATTATASVAEGSPLVFLATAVPASPDADRSALEVSPRSLEASGGSSAATVTVTVRDRHGNPVPNVAVVLSATGSGNRLTQPSAPTNDAGVATGRFSSTAAGAHVISATAAGVKIDQTVKVTVAPGAADGGSSQVIVPNGTAGAVTTVTLRLRDRFGNAVTGVRSKIDIDVSGANPRAKLSIAEAADAEYTAKYTPTQAGTDLVRVAFDDTALFGGPFTSAVVAGPAASATTVAVVDDVATVFVPFVDVTIEARDAFGNPIRRPGENITVTGVFGADRRAIDMAYEASAGVYVGVFRPWDFGEFSVEVAVNGVQIPGSPFKTVKRTF